MEDIVARSRFLPRALLILALGCSGDAESAGAAGSAVWFEGTPTIAGDGSDPIDDAAFLVAGVGFTVPAQANP